MLCVAGAVGTAAGCVSQSGSRLHESKGMILLIAILKNTAYHIAMKTTIELADDLVAILKKRTVHEGISMRAAVHQALRLWIKSQPESSTVKTISRDVGLMGGQGLTSEASARSWEELRALSYDPKA